MDFEQAPLYAERLELFRGRVSSELWSYFIANSFYYLVFTFSYLLVGIKLTSTAVFSIVFALFLRSILIVRIRNVFKYQRIWKSYIVSGAVILLWSIYALYSSGFFYYYFPVVFRHSWSSGVLFQRKACGYSGSLSCLVRI